MTAALRFAAVGKSYGGRRVLDAVDVALRAGEVHALLGENGAGKTTLVRMALGLVAPDEGTLLVDEAPVRFASPADAAARGIGMVHQHFALADGLTVAENLALGTAPLAWRRGELERRAAALLARHGVRLDPATRVGDLTVGEKQRLEIAKALARAERVLILDEPTAVLAPAEADALLDSLAELRRRGLAIVLITHRLDEALRAAQRFTVLRQGRVVLTAARGETGAPALAAALFGTSTETVATVATSATPATPASPASDAAAASRAAAPPRLVARGLAGERFGPLDLELRAGERVAITGVDGNGQGELLETLAQLRAPSAGTLEIAAGRRAWISGDRHAAGLALDLSVAENALLDRGALPRGLFSRRTLAERAAPRLARFDVRCSGPWQPARELSGGNQQKAVLARELDGEPTLVLAENPSRGLDLQATAFVQRALLAAAARGAALLVATTDLDEALALGERLYVIHRGALHRCAPTRAAVAERLAALADAARGDEFARAIAAGGAPR